MSLIAIRSRRVCFVFILIKTLIQAASLDGSEGMCVCVPACASVTMFVCVCVENNTLPPPLPKQSVCLPLSIDSFLVSSHVRCGKSRYPNTGVCLFWSARCWTNVKQLHLVFGHLKKQMPTFCSVLTGRVTEQCHCFPCWDLLEQICHHRHIGLWAHCQFAFLGAEHGVCAVNLKESFQEWVNKMFFFSRLPGKNDFL